MDSLSSASYSQMSSGAPATGFTRLSSSGVNAIQGGIDKVQSRCHTRAKLTYLTITSIVVMIFTCAALGGPWSISTTNSQGVGSTKYTYTLTHVNSETCTAAGSCTTTDAVWNGGVNKAAGDASAALLAIVLLDSFTLIFSSLSLLLTSCKIADAPMPLKQIKGLRTRTFVATLLTTIAVIAFPATTTANIAQQNTPGPATTTYSFSYGGGFAVAIINILLLLLGCYFVQEMVEELEVPGGVNERTAFAALPVGLPSHPEVSYDHAKTASFSGIYPDPNVAVGEPSAYQGGYQGYQGNA